MHADSETCTRKYEPDPRGSDEEHQEGNRQGRHRSVADPLERIRKARDDGAAGEIDAGAVNHRHRTERDQDGVDAHPRDESAGNQSNQG